MGSTIPYGRQTISAADIAAVVDVLQSDFLTQGPVVPAFEDAVAACCGARHAVAVNSATSALHIACKALGVGPGDRVWTSPLTFVASANAALYCGADVDFVDVDPRSYNMCPERLAEKLEDAAASATLPKVIIPVHLAGQSCDMAAIHAAASRYGVRIIEDASHAIGGSYRDQPVGNCRFSDIAVFSFHPVKIITTGEGGMALTNDDTLAELMRLDRSHGITRDPELLTEADAAPWYYEQQRLGFNYRLTDVAAALGLSQLSALHGFIARRRQIASAYDAALSTLPVTTPWQHPDAQSSWHLYVVRIDPRRTSRTHREVFAALRAAGIGVNLHYIPVYLQPYYRALGFAPGLCPAAEAYYGEAISLPMFAGLTDAQQAEVIAGLAGALAE
ncbi:UDP-4-amino-4,6-dideoxy-N-acetyl-beta-L-altrosamine transaminase [Erythrobacter sp. W302b]|uniref:UDP-4-amino-4, 6-dideoxy-N-acetyl-beta-L-altrosamine transaminase n=1 Tax=Erythrobacter sp. W302b TaxID=3389874 RepID=UPI00396B15AE